MIQHCRLFHVDAFTRQRFCGNPARVILGGDELSDEQMQTIATELNGETAFVLAAESGDHDMQVRFFTPDHEVPFVGHVTLATHYVLAKCGLRGHGVVRQRSHAGIAEVELAEVDGDYRISLTISPPSLGPVLPEHQRVQVLDALGISSPYLQSDCPLQILTKGGSRLLVGLRSPELLHPLKPDMQELIRLTSHIGAEGYFVFALNAPGEQDQISTVSRMFCPAIGIPEDPVSGNAHGMLGTYLLAHNLVTAKEGLLHFRGYQGKSVKRPGEVEVAVTCAGAVAQSVRISGDAVIIYEAALPL
ncbi:MAG: PhzF family phenazine biosynthesis isomerase [Steroidobacteraceae bacterium]